MLYRREATSGRGQTELTNRPSLGGVLGQRVSADEPQRDLHASGGGDGGDPERRANEITQLR